MAHPTVSHTGLFFGFLAQPPPPLVFCKPTTPPPPPPHAHRLTISPHHSPLPFPMAHPKSSHGGLVSGFWPKPPPCLAFCKPTTPHVHHPITLHCCFQWQTRNQATASVAAV